MSTIRNASSDSEIAACFAVMQQLRPQLVAAEFVARVRRQMAGGFLLAYLESEGSVRAVAGYRFLDNLVSGRILYVDDLVSDSTQRSLGHGAQLLDWLAGQARDNACRYLELDSGVQRFDAHRFYLRQRLHISSHHFRLEL